MADKDIEQPDEKPQPVPPWWADIGRRGALGMVVFGGAVAAWIFLAPVLGLPSLPFVPDETAVGYYQAAKIAAIGLVILGAALFAGRSRTADGEAPEAGQRPEGQEPETGQAPGTGTGKEPGKGSTKEHEG